MPTTERRLSDYVRFDLHRVTREAEYMSLAGLSPEDCDGADPYADAERELEQALTDLRAMRSHRHAWDENGFCGVCGADGNA